MKLVLVILTGLLFSTRVVCAVEHSVTEQSIMTRCVSRGDGHRPDTGHVSTHAYQASTHAGLVVGCRIGLGSVLEYSVDGIRSQNAKHGKMQRKKMQALIHTQLLNRLTIQVVFSLIIHKVELQMVQIQSDSHCQLPTDSLHSNLNEMKILYSKGDQGKRRAIIRINSNPALPEVQP